MVKFSIYLNRRVFVMLRYGALTHIPTMSCALPTLPYTALLCVINTVYSLQAPVNLFYSVWIGPLSARGLQICPLFIFKRPCKIFFFTVFVSAGYFPVSPPRINKTDKSRPCENNINTCIGIPREGHNHET